MKTLRQKYLLDLLEANHMMSVSDLAEKLESSMMTIRRDLEYLEQQGLIKKVHGGAVLLDNDKEQPSFQ